jgi:hypothetical protein
VDQYDRIMRKVEEMDDGEKCALIQALLITLDDNTFARVEFALNNNDVNLILGD